MFGFPHLHQVRSLLDPLPQLLRAVPGEKTQHGHPSNSRLTNRASASSRSPGDNSPLHKGPLLPTAPSVPTEGSLHRGTVELSYGMTPSTQGIKGDFLLTPAIFKDQKCVLGEQPSPGALLRAGIPTPSSLQPAGCSPAEDDSPALLAAGG